MKNIPLSAKKMGHINLMQSVAAQLPHAESMLSFSRQGLSQFPGVSSVETSLLPQMTFSTPPKKDAFLIFSVEKDSCVFGKIGFILHDPAAFQPYIPYIQNYCVLLGVIIAEKRQAAKNRELRKSLEERVQRRTQHLQEEIEERTQIQDRLTEERERLAVTLRSIGDGVITTDTTGKIVLINPVAEALCGYTQKEAAGKPLTQVFSIIHQSTRKPHENPVHKVLKTKQVVELANHTVLIHRDGSERIIADSGAPIIGTGGEIQGVVLVFRDMTEKERMVESAQNTQKLDSLGRLAGGIAHEFNNLMGGIYGFIDIAQSFSRDPDARHYLDRALETITRAKKLTRQLLTFSTGGEPHPTVQAVPEFIRQRCMFALGGSRVKIRFDFTENLHLCTFDRDQIGQVMDNLVRNAAEAMETGTIVVGGENFHAHTSTPLLEAGDYVRIFVADQGPGIPASLHKKIFDPFFTTKEDKRGLGLTASYSIMQRHEGGIDFTTRENRGTTFSIYLPAAQTPKEPAPKPQDSTKGRGTVLVMDDEDILREIISLTLKSEGFDVICAGEGQEALGYFIREQNRGPGFQAIILDLTVPGGMGGVETAKNIRTHDGNIPIFVASGYADDPVMKDPAAFGITASISKPFKTAELRELINTHLTAQ
jgi:PAS domain S-box-containing protein